jgi:hypothetical protein
MRDVVDVLLNLRDGTMYDRGASSAYEMWHAYINPRRPRAPEPRWEPLVRIEFDDDEVDGPNGDDLYGDDMPGMTMEAFQKWTDELIAEIGNDRDEIDA